MHTHEHSHLHSETAPATLGRTIRWARYYDYFVRLLSFGKIDALREETLRRATLSLGTSVLDVGCGTGSLALLAKTRVGNGGLVYGIDASPEMIAVARQKVTQQKSEANFQLGLIEAIPFVDNTFDVVLSSLMFHHLPGDLKAQGLAEIYRVLKPGGRLLIVDIKRPTRFTEHISMAVLSHHGMSSGVQDLMPLLQKVGFHAVQSGNMKWGPIGFVEGERGD